MNKRKGLSLITLILLTLFTEGIGVCAPAKLIPDSSSITINLPEESYFDSFRQDKAFDYGAEFIAAQPTGLLARLLRFLRKVWEGLKNVFVIIPFLFRLVIFALIIFFLILIFTRTRLNRLLFSQKNLAPPPFEVDYLEEDITDFDTAIANMVEQKQYRSAVRLLYLKTIHRLSKFEIIGYSREKTNRDYLFEIKDNSMKEGFMAITDVYNRVWYGHFSVDSDTFAAHRNRFDQFLKENQLV